VTVTVIKVIMVRIQYNSSLLWWWTRFFHGPTDFPPSLSLVSVFYRYHYQDRGCEWKRSPWWNCRLAWNPNWRSTSEPIIASVSPFSRSPHETPTPWRWQIGTRPGRCRTALQSVQKNVTWETSGRRCDFQWLANSRSSPVSGSRRWWRLARYVCLFKVWRH